MNRNKSDSAEYGTNGIRIGAIGGSQNVFDVRKENPFNGSGDSDEDAVFGTQAIDEPIFEGAGGEEEEAPPPGPGVVSAGGATTRSSNSRSTQQPAAARDVAAVDSVLAMGMGRSATLPAWMTADSNITTNRTFSPSPVILKIAKK